MLIFPGLLIAAVLFCIMMMIKSIPFWLCYFVPQLVMVSLQCISFYYNVIVYASEDEEIKLKSVENIQSLKSKEKEKVYVSDQSKTSHVTIDGVDEYGPEYP